MASSPHLRADTQLGGRGIPSSHRSLYLPGCTCSGQHLGKYRKTRLPQWLQYVCGGELKRQPPHENLQPPTSSLRRMLRPGG